MMLPPRFPRFDLIFAVRDHVDPEETRRVEQWLRNRYRWDIRSRSKIIGMRRLSRFRKRRMVGRPGRNLYKV